MGLDMYLNASKYFWHDEEPTITVNGKPFKAKEIRCEAAYWRKANAIHGWFVRNVQGGEDECKPHDVSREQLIELRDLCASILKARGNQRETLINKKLPPTSGFFFGNTTDREYYLADLKDTVAKLDAALKEYSEEDGWEFEYRSSW